MTRPPRRPSIRPSLVDIGWESVPSVVPNDTVVGGSTESNELTAPIRPSAPNASQSPSEYSEPTGNIDDLLDESDSGLGLPAVGGSRLPAPPSVPRFPAAAPVTPRSAPPPPRSAPPPPPSSRHPLPPPSSRPRPPSVRPPGRHGATQPLAAPPGRRPFPLPPPMPPRMPPPRPHLPSGGPLQDLGDGLPRLDSEDDTLLTELSRPNPMDWEAPPSSGTPSSRLPAGIVIPGEVAPVPRTAPSLAFAPTEEIPVVPEPMPVPAVAPPPSRSPASEATQPAARLRAGLAPTVPSPVVELPPSSQLPPPSSRFPSSHPAEPTLAQALMKRVRVGSLRVPLGIPVAAAIFAVAVTFGLIMALITSVTASTPAAVPQASAATASDPAPTSEAPAAEEPERPAPRGSTPVERAQSGDEQALRELSERPATERTIAESLAIAAGRAEIEKRELTELGKQAKAPDFASDTAGVRKLLGFVRRDDTSLGALALIARIEGPLGPDLLYHVWTSTRRKDASTELAEALVFSKEVRPRASPALAVALDLRTVEDCEPTLKVVSRAVEHADRRALSLLVRLNNKRGCGPRKNQDCYPCLRDGEQLEQAIKVARKRQAPRF